MSKKTKRVETTVTVGDGIAQLEKESGMTEQHVVPTPVNKEDNTVRTVKTISKQQLISSLCREGLPLYMFDTTVSFRWENSTITLDIRDCDVLDMYRYPLPDQDRRGDFAVPHYLGLSTDSISLPCMVDGNYTIGVFQHLKANRLLKAYFAKHREYAQNLSDIINWIWSLSDTEYIDFVTKKVSGNEAFNIRIKF